MRRCLSAIAHRENHFSAKKDFGMSKQEKTTHSGVAGKQDFILRQVDYFQSRAATLGRPESTVEYQQLAVCLRRARYWKERLQPAPSPAIDTKAVLSKAARRST
ncbi:MAG: hypothetical protein DRQ37_05290 [Gammaproteobacteria bacterium]|nr:MAG: hypothetical protein DRQ37_05290 [Gammaproteobacteria bacterium]